MNPTTITAGQCLLDVCVQELGDVSALFDLADTNGLAITDTLVPGQQMAVPESPNGQAEVAAYFRARNQRLNTGAPAAPAPAPRRHDFKQTDFTPLDFS